jgi:FMN reductase
VRITVVAGNPKPQSRTLQVALRLVEHLAPGGPAPEVVDLAEHADELFAWPSETMAALNEQVATSDLVVLASPTYKATYTALLKAFLDRYAAGGLAGVTVIPVMTGGDLTHAMGADSHLVPLLLELGAVVPGRGLYFVTSQMDELDSIVAEAATTYAANLARLAALHTSISTPEAVAAGKDPS